MVTQSVFTGEVTMNGGSAVIAMAIVWDAHVHCPGIYVLLIRLNVI